MVSSEEEQPSPSMLNDDFTSPESPLMSPRLFNTIRDGSNRYTDAQEEELLLLGGLIDLDGDKYSHSHQHYCYPEQQQSTEASERDTLGEFITQTVQDQQFNTNTTPRQCHTFISPADDTISLNNNNIYDNDNIYALQEKPDIKPTTVNDYNTFSTSPSIPLLLNSLVSEAIAKATAEAEVISSAIVGEADTDNGLSELENQAVNLNSLNIRQTYENDFQDRVEETFEAQSVLNKSSPSEISSLSDVDATTISSILNNCDIKYDLDPECQSSLSSFEPLAHDLIEEAPTIAKCAQSDDEFVRIRSLSDGNEWTSRSGKRRKSVRFADECGFCLESVRMMVRICFLF